MLSWASLMIDSSPFPYLSGPLFIPYLDYYNNLLKYLPAFIFVTQIHLRHILEFPSSLHPLSLQLHRSLPTPNTWQQKGKTYAAMFIISGYPWSNWFIESCKLDTSPNFEPWRPESIIIWYWEWRIRARFASLSIKNKVKAIVRRIGNQEQSEGN